jgi:hypothetical protein
LVELFPPKIAERELRFWQSEPVHPRDLVAPREGDARLLREVRPSSNGLCDLAKDRLGATALEGGHSGACLQIFEAEGIPFSVDRHLMT